MLLGKSIAILGLGSESTLHYIDALNQKYNAIFGAYSTCPFVMHNVDFNTINIYLPDNYKAIEPILKKHLDGLNSSEIKRILIPNITLHKCIDKMDLDAELVNKICHPLKLLKAYFKNNKVKNFVVFGTKHSMVSNYFKDYTLQAKQVNISNSDLNTLENLRNNVYKKGLTAANKKILRQLIDKYDGTTKVIIACTELSLLLKKNKIKHCIDLADMQINSALQVCK